MERASGVEHSNKPIVAKDGQSISFRGMTFHRDRDGSFRSRKASTKDDILWMKLRIEEAAG